MQLNLRQLETFTYLRGMRQKIAFGHLITKKELSMINLETPLPTPEAPKNGAFAAMTSAKLSSEIAAAPLGAGPEPFLDATKTCAANCGNTNWAGCTSDCISS
ncbi:hypothetical protein [Thalassospira tepidiphila]|uniref:hypothetical protein n=1 Tax=Thalassospira tepidiphila TaxID=393657 RepID=UPI0030C7663C